MFPLHRCAVSGFSYCTEAFTMTKKFSGLNKTWIVYEVLRWESASVEIAEFTS